jgi:hypothetical protein
MILCSELERYLASLLSRIRAQRIRDVQVSLADTVNASGSGGSPSHPDPESAKEKIALI